jgi:hypothetical protein
METEAGNGREKGLCPTGASHRPPARREGGTQEREREGAAGMTLSVVSTEVKLRTNQANTMAIDAQGTRGKGSG